MPRLRSTCTVLLLSDICALLFSFLAALLLRALAGDGLDVDVYLGVLPGFSLFILLYAALGLYPGILRPAYDELKRLSIGTSTGFLFLSFLFFMSQQGLYYSRFVMLGGWTLALMLVPMFRHCARKTFARKPWWGYPVLLFGPEEKSDAVLREFVLHPEEGLVIADRVFFSPDAEARRSLDMADSVQMEATLAALQRDYPTAIAFMMGDDLPPEKRETLIMLLSRYFRRVIVQFGDTWTKQSTLKVADVPGGLVLTMRQNLLDPARMRVKRLLDLTLCALGSVVLVPLIPLLALLIRLDSKGPVFFTQERLGQGGKPIRVWKFRTMVADAEEVLRKILDEDPAMREAWEKDQKLPRDPRLTRLGRFLRHTSLDELPQILNVLRNEMSLVGPRPIVEDEISRYGEAYELYKRVKPGITGLWQVSGRNDVSYATRVKLDQHYVYNWSVWLDIYIIIRTLPAMLTGSGAY